MQEREAKWKNLSNDTKDFVEKHLLSSLGLSGKPARDFLFPVFDETGFGRGEIKDMEKATERILKAIKKGETICVYGDYDCDGVPGVAMAKDFFEKINYSKVLYYIPDRHKEGYGMKSEVIQKLSEQGVKLILTIDLGTTNIEEVDLAKKLGIDVIITDHHLPIETEDGQMLPQAYAILNNKQADCGFLDKNLCGSGILWMLLTNVIEKGLEEKILGNEKINQGYAKWFLDLVSIATVADMVPLTGLNRTLAIYGLIVLGKTKRAGLHTLFRNGGVDMKKVSETDISFVVAPRINSASRMASPMMALSLFSSDTKEGTDSAHALEELNTERKDSVKNIMKKVYKTLDEKFLSISPPNIIVIGSPDWGAGVLGILASKILDRYSSSVFVYGGEYEESGKRIFKGSCRSRGDIHLVKLMDEVKNKFSHFGGHELAGGFSIAFDEVHDLEKVLNEKYEVARIENLTLQRKNDNQKNCYSINLEKINFDLLQGLELLGPFGVGNPRPVFKLSNVLETRIERFGKSKEHLKIVMRGHGEKDRKLEREAIKFFVERKEEEDILEKLSKGEILYEVEPGFRTSTPRLKILI
jgi:single-stranded-DNA-specific exonuclease